MPLSKDIEGEIAKVSEYVTFKINLGNYSSIEVSFGHSRPCNNNPADIQAVADEIHRLNERTIKRRARQYVAAAEKIAGEGEYQ